MKETCNYTCNSCTDFFMYYLDGIDCINYDYRYKYVTHAICYMASADLVGKSGMPLRSVYRLISSDRGNIMAV